VLEVGQLLCPDCRQRHFLGVLIFHDCFPSKLVCRVLETLADFLKGRVRFLQAEDTLPNLIVNNICCKVFLFLEIGSRSTEEEVPFVKADLICTTKDSCGVHERKEKLVLLKQTSADVDIRADCYVIDQDLQPFFENVRLL
jgi:hypothetical protein